MEQGKIKYAGFWIRVMACIIDLIVYLPFYFVIRFLAEGEQSVSSFTQPGSWLAEGIFIVFALVTYAWLFAAPWQGSPGMRLFRFKVMTTDGKRLSFARALVWGLTGTVGWLFALGGILYLQSHYDLKAINQFLYSGDPAAVMEKLADPVVQQELFGGSFETFQFYILVAFLVSVALCTIWSLSIGLTREKTGFHNVLCGTRFIKDTPSP